MKKKHMLLTADNEPNIAVIEIPEGVDVHNEEIAEKIAEALSEHFDQEVKIKAFQINAYIPITGHFNILLDQEGVAIVITIDINETWVY